MPTLTMSMGSGPLDLLSGSAGSCQGEGAEAAPGRNAPGPVPEPAMGPGVEARGDGASAADCRGPSVEDRLEAEARPKAEAVIAAGVRADGGLPARPGGPAGEATPLPSDSCDRGAGCRNGLPWPPPEMPGA